MAVHAEVRRYLDARGLKWEALAHGEAESAAEEAAAVGTDPDHVAKTLLLHLSRGYAVAVISGGRRADKRKLHAATGDKHARLATEAEMAEAFPEYPLGTLPPLPRLLGIPAYLDPLVAGRGTIVFPAGSHTESARMAVADLLAAESFIRADLSVGPAEI